MNTLIEHGRVIDPATGRDEVADLAIADGRIAAIGAAPADFAPQRRIDARGCWVLPGLVDLAARLPRLECDMRAAVAGGVTSLVCPPDTDPVLDEPGLVEMLITRATRLGMARVLPQGALTRGLKGEALTEMVRLTEAGCVAFGHADVPLVNTQVLQRTMQYADTFGYAVWLRPQDAWLGGSAAASGALATRMGLASVPVAAETIALHTIFELMRAVRSPGSSGPRVHICRISSAAGAALLRQAKAEGLPVTADVSINNLLLCDEEAMCNFDSRARLLPPLRQAADRQALGQALADGTLDALVSNHAPVGSDAKHLPFAEAEAGAVGLELLLPLALHWAGDDAARQRRALACVTSGAAAVIGSGLGDELQGSCGQLHEGALADVCVFDPAARWMVGDDTLHSAGKNTPFEGREMCGRVRYTFTGGQLAWDATADGA